MHLLLRSAYIFTKEKTHMPYVVLFLNKQYLDLCIVLFFLLPLSSLFLSYLFLPSFSVRLILNIVNESTENKTAGEKKWNDGVSVWREGVNTLGQSLRFSLNMLSIYLLVTMTTCLQPSQISQPGVQLHWLQNTLLTCHNTLPTQHPALHLIYIGIYTQTNTHSCVPEYVQIIFTLICVF